MFRFRIFNFILFFCIYGFYACSPKLNQFENLLDRVTAKPEMLVMHRDSVRVQLQGALPLRYLNKDTKIYLYPEYRYGEGALRLGEFVPFDGEYVLANTEVRLNESIVFPYLSGMDEGEFVLKAQVDFKGNTYSVPEKVLAKGLNTLPLLARVGQITPDEPIPDIGIFMTVDFSGINTQEIRDFVVPFALGKSDQLGRGLPANLQDFLRRGESGMALRKITITGLVSPENQELADHNLAFKRAESVKGSIQQVNAVKEISIESTYRRNDWFDFRILLGEYEGISETDKDRYYSILLDGTDFESQLRKMRQLPTYNKVYRDIFPRLRVAKVQVLLENVRYTDPEIAASVYRLLYAGQPLDGFTREHLIYAGHKATRLHEKEAIYKKLVEIHPSELSYNNLGVVYLNQAQRSLGVQEKNMYIQNAISMFREANKIRTSSISMHNLGRALILRGDYFDAYVAISEASALERNESNEFLRFNEGVRGALDIMNGDYKLATIRLNRAPETSLNLFNKGLAYLLADDLGAATIAFEESVQLNRDYGYGFYGLAVIAAISRDRQALFENLRKATERSEYLKERALRDILFKAYHSDPEFMNVFR